MVRLVLGNHRHPHRSRELISRSLLRSGPAIQVDRPPHSCARGRACTRGSRRGTSRSRAAEPPSMFDQVRELRSGRVLIRGRLRLETCKSVLGFFSASSPRDMSPEGMLAQIPDFCVGSGHLTAGGHDSRYIRRESNGAACDESPKMSHVSRSIKGTRVGESRSGSMTRRTGLSPCSNSMNSRLACGPGALSLRRVPRAPRVDPGRGMDQPRRVEPLM